MTTAMTIAMAAAMATPEVSEIVFSRPPETQNTASERTEQEEFDVLVEAAREFGTRYGATYFKAEATFSKAFAENVDDFLRLREMFPKQGSHATRRIGGVEYTWKSFCQQFLYITPEYFGQLVRRLRPDRNKVKPKPRSIEDTPSYRAGYRKGREEAEEEAVPNVDEDAKELEEELDGAKDEGALCHKSNRGTSPTDAHAYFAQYKGDTEQFAEEMRAIVRHFGLARQISINLLI
jgi:hypothetical protein